MNNTKKKVISVIVAIVMMLSMMPMSAFAADSSDDTSAAYSSIIDTLEGIVGGLSSVFDEVEDVAKEVLGVDCLCLCHSDFFLVEALFGIVLYVYEMFGIQEFCDCGARHWGTDEEEEKVDSDGDGVSDEKELELGTDPYSYDDSFDIVVTVEETSTFASSVALTLSGEQVETLTVEEVDNEVYFPTDMPGYIGSAYDFSVDGDFEEATISFTFDEDLLLDEDFEPTIYYFNEIDQVLEELETTVINNVASTVVEHFSTYILLNKGVYDGTFSWQDFWVDPGVSYTDIEIVLVIDDSGSMDWNDPDDERLTVAVDLIDKLPTDSKIGIVLFGSSSNIQNLTSELTTDKDEAKSYLTTSYFKSSGGTYMYKGITSGLNLFSTEDDETTLKLMIVLSDGDTSDTSSYSTVVASAKDNNVIIYSVGLGSYEQTLINVAEATGGECFDTEDASGLTEIYNYISEQIDIYADSDGDGIPDYYEDNLILFNGVQIVLDKNDPDTDGDGVPDGEEVTLKYYYNDDETKVMVVGTINSHPLLVDSDGDGYSDYVDAYPLNPLYN